MGELERRSVGKRPKDILEIPILVPCNQCRLALGTGLRRGDIESLKVIDIDFERNCITTTSRKTGKSKNKSK
jgi:integrase